MNKILNVTKEERSQLQEGCEDKYTPKLNVTINSNLCDNINLKTNIKHLIVSIFCFIFVILGFISSYNIGYRNGSDYGFVTALDTVNKICEKQINNDSVVTKLVLLKKDTVAYILESKRVLEK